MEVLKSKIIVIAILIFVVSKINGQKIDFKLGDSNYEGTVKSISIFEYHRLKDEKGSLPLDKIPNTYREFNQAGKLICEVRTSENKSSILSNNYDELDNIRYQIRYKFPYTKDREEFLKKKKVFKGKLEVLLDSLKEGHPLQGNDEVLEIEKFYYDHPTLSITKVSRKSLQPTIWKVDKLGNIIYQENYQFQHGVTKKYIIERKYLEDKIIYDVSDGSDQKIYRQYLYDAQGNLSNKIAFNDQAALIRSEVYKHDEKGEVIKIFDKKNNLVSELVKTVTPEMIKQIIYSIDEKGNAQMTLESRQYKDEYNNIIKIETENNDFNRVNATELLFEYY